MKFTKLLSVILFALVAVTAEAQVTAKQLANVGMAPELANQVIKMVNAPTGSAVYFQVNSVTQATLNTSGFNLALSGRSYNYGPAAVPTMAATPVAGTNVIVPGLNIVPTAAANTAALLPPTPVVGQTFKIVNSGPNAVRIKAGGTSTLNGATAGGYISVATLATVDCFASTTSNYNCQQPVIPTPAGP